MKKPILVFLIASNPFLKALRPAAPTICWSSIFHLLTTLLKKYFRQSRVHLILLNFSVWPLVPLLLLSSVNKSSSHIIDLPWDILKTSIKSCLFLLSSVAECIRLAQDRRVCRELVSSSVIADLQTWSWPKATQIFTGVAVRGGGGSQSSIE